MPSRRPSAPVSAKSCFRRSFSFSARTPTSRCSGSRGGGCGRRAKRSATTFRCASMRRPRHAIAAPTIPRELNGGAATGVLAAHTKIRAIDSRKRTVPSGRGRRRIRPRSAIATSSVRRASPVRGATSRRVRRVATGRGRPSRRDHEPSGNRGSANRPAAASGHGPPASLPTNRMWRGDSVLRDRASRAVARRIRERVVAGGSTSHQAARLEAIARGETNRAGNRRVIGRGATDRQGAHRAAIAKRGRTNGQAATANRSARAPVPLRTARVRSATMSRPIAGEAFFLGNVVERAGR